MGAKVKSKHFLNKNMESLAHLLFPKKCLICSTELNRNENHICQNCDSELPQMYLAGGDPTNPIHKVFWGRVQLEHAFAWLFYNNELSTKEILHAIKYKDKPQLARAMGEKLGEAISDFEWIKTIDALIPVPIHPKKKFIRGYNQSEEIAKGMKAILNIPIDNYFLNRNLHTDSQTKKGRFGRWDNIEDAFRSEKNKNAYQHIAIIDDVITTGATMERIIHQIQEKNPDLRISVISLAFAQ